jgi:hypothetical protein
MRKKELECYSLSRILPWKGKRSKPSGGLEDQSKVCLSHQPNPLEDRVEAQGVDLIQAPHQRRQDKIDLSLGPRVAKSSTVYASRLVVLRRIQARVYLWHPRDTALLSHVQRVSRCR